MPFTRLSFKYCFNKPIECFRSKDPIVLGVDIVKGVLKIGTPLVFYDKERRHMKVGKVMSIEANHKPLQTARKADGSVAIKFGDRAGISVERDDIIKYQLCSELSRKSIDLLLEHFRDEMLNSDWDVVRELKPFFEIFTAASKKWFIIF